MKNIFIAFFLLSTFALAQEDDGTNARLKNDFAASNANLSGAWIYTSGADKDIDGSVYLFDNWNTYGVITTVSDDKSLALKELNYDTKKDVFVAKIAQDSVFEFSDKDIKEISINNRKFKKYKDVNTNRKTYFEVLGVSKDIKILKKYEKVLKKGILDPLTQVKPKDKYILKETYYFYKNNKIEKVKLSKKTFSNIFGDKSGEIKKYISKNKISIKNEKYIQVILNYYNTL